MLTFYLGSYKSAQCFGGAKDEEIYTSHFDKKSNKIYIPGASSSGTIAGTFIIVIIIIIYFIYCLVFYCFPFVDSYFSRS